MAQPGHRRFPAHVLSFAPFGGRIGVRREAVAEWAAPLAPLLGGLRRVDERGDFYLETGVGVGLGDSLVASVEDLAQDGGELEVDRLADLRVGGIQRDREAEDTENDLHSQHSVILARILQFPPPVRPPTRHIAISSPTHDIMPEAVTALRPVLSSKES